MQEVFRCRAEELNWTCGDAHARCGSGRWPSFAHVPADRTTFCVIRAWEQMRAGERLRGKLAFCVNPKTWQFREDLLPPLTHLRADRKSFASPNATRNCTLRVNSGF